MKLLFISQHVPWRRQSSQHGIFQRLRMLLEACCTAFDDVSLLLIAPASAAPPPSERAALSEQLSRSFGPRIQVHLALIEEAEPTRLATASVSGRIGRYLGPDPFHLARYPQTSAVIQQQIARVGPAMIFAHRLEVFAALRQAKAIGTTPVIMDLDDVEHLSQWRSIMNPPYWWSKFMLLGRMPGILTQERLALKTCQSVSVCSTQDIAKLSWLGSTASVTVIPNAITDPLPLASALSPANAGQDLLFVGSFSYHPNRVGLQWFCTTVWPLVLATHPHLRLRVAGQHADTLPPELTAGPNIDVLGFVDDLKPHYAQAGVVICPILSGGGTRLKIIEACAHQRAVVSTRIGAEGLALDHPVSILIADRARDFADCVLRLVDDPGARQQIATQARLAFVRHYRRETVVAMAANQMMARTEAAKRAPPTPA